MVRVTVIPGMVGIMCGATNATNPIIVMGTQMSFLLVISHFFQIILSPLGQPGTIAHILAGLVLGPSGVSQFDYARRILLEKHASSYYQFEFLVAGIIIMFMAGIQIDIAETKRNLQRSSIVAISASMVSGIFAFSISSFIYNKIIYNEINITDQIGKNEVQEISTTLFPFLVILIMVNTASPVVIRLVAELKLSSTNVGQLATSSSLINDIGCLIMLTCYLLIGPHGKEDEGYTNRAILSLVFMGIGFFVFGIIVWWYAKRNRDKIYLTKAEILIILVFLVVVGMAIEGCGQSSMIACFVFGLMVPREGKISRTLLRKFTFHINTFILPIYFAYIGFQTNIPALFTKRNMGAAAAVVLVTMGGRIAGTLAACHYLKTPLDEGVVLALLLNLKGFVDLQVISIIVQSEMTKSWGQPMYDLFVTSLVINTLIGGSTTAYLVKKGMARTYLYSHTPLSLQNDNETELRVLACVQSPHQATAVTTLIAMMTRCRDALVIPNILHLLQLHKKPQKLLFEELEDHKEFLKEANDYGKKDELEISKAIDSFIVKTRVTMRYHKMVSTFQTMYEEVCNKAEDFNASVILLCFHKHKRIDRKMESVKMEGFRLTNQKILRHAPCTVAMLVNKRSVVGYTQVPVPEERPHVAVLLSGGRDDHESLAFSTRIGNLLQVQMTIIRFQHHALNNELDNEADNTFVSDFRNRYVRTGLMKFVEKYVKNGAETVSVLRDMKDTYSLFIVGKGGTENSPITTGMVDWEESPELGKIGDFLASSDFDTEASILVIQQHRHSENELLVY